MILLTVSPMIQLYICVTHATAFTHLLSHSLNTLTCSLPHSHTPSVTHTFTHSHTLPHSLTHCLTHSHTPSLAHSLTHPHTPSLTWYCRTFTSLHILLLQKLKLILHNSGLGANVTHILINWRIYKHNHIIELGYVQTQSYCWIGVCTNTISHIVELGCVKIQ